MPLKVATWNMDHWKGSRATSEHTARVWDFAASLNADIVLLQEAAPPPEGFGATVFPPPTATSRWHSGGRAAFGTAIAVFGHESSEIEVGPLGGDRTNRLTQTHPGAFVAARITVGTLSVVAVSLYGMFEGPLLDKVTYSVTSLHRSLSDVTPLFQSTKTAVVMGGDLNVSTQIAPPHRTAHDLVFRRIAAFGVGDCTQSTSATRKRLTDCPCAAGELCAHVQTHRHPKSRVPWQNDYLFASEKTLMPRLVSCEVIDTERAWALSDHCPVVATFE